ncbi:MFS transporter [Actinoplanes awajinensis]|uniref:Puromycin resistance protein pur8 n=1 Tax=Actinoplanes awajinensis subsp. mycoplanecinus TaxID=135947 RepID=A0A101JBU6_9ACTN|nr:MFS transporter [Actinoplanes awajinensis]KUL23918.1 Puromycin resistance protein pur8 [Actinoplanes awajinensis subsp. mycoplanecinus]
MTNVDLGARPQAGAAPAAHNPHHSRRWAILAVLGLAQLMVILDASIVNIALPSAQTALNFSTDDRQWIVTAYALAFGALLPLGGRVGDFIGRKTALIIGLIGFALASGVGGAATGFGTLVLARAGQGVFGALLAPAVLSLLTTTFTDARERAKAFGIYGALAGAGGAIGLLAGGLLTEYLNWRWCMYVNIIFAAIAAAGAAVLLHNQRADGRSHRIDVPGTLTVSAGLFAVVYGFANAETDGFGAAGTWGWLVAGVLLLAAFGVIETRVSQPLIPMRVLLDRTRGGAIVAVLLTGVGMFAIFLFLTFYLQQNLGFSPVRSGVAFLPMVFALATTATVSSTVLLPRTGPRPLVPAGFLIGAAGLLWLAQIDAASTYAADVVGPLIVTGIGFGLAMAPSMTAGTSGVEPHDAGVASALVNTAQQVGGSIGTAVLSTVAASAMTDFLAGKQVSPDVLAGASIHSYTSAFTWAAGVFIAGAVICGLLLRSGPLDADPDGAPAAHM